MTLIELAGSAPAPGVYGAPMPAAFQPGLVSVILPAYNRAEFVGEAMNSVWNQTHRPIELVVVDDGSTDHTAEVVRARGAAWPLDAGFRAVYLRQPNRGASAARNQGLLHSHGEFIQYLDSDDVLMRHKLARHVAVLRADETLDLVWSDWLVLPSEEVQSRLEQENQSEPSPGPTHSPVTNRLIPWEPWATLSRRRFVAAHPLWNEKTSRWDDWEYALRLLAAEPKRGFVPGLGCIQRQHVRGRRQDLDFDPAGVEKGLMAAREAGRVRDQAVNSRPDVDQLVANRFWELFLEALHHGRSEQALESIREAGRYGRRPPFRIKVGLVRRLFRAAGPKATFALLRHRYYQAG